MAGVENRAPVLVVDLCELPSDEPASRSKRLRAAAPHAPAVPVDVIDLTDDDINAVFRQWELVDLTGDDEAPAAKPAPPAIPDNLAEQRARINAFLAAKATALRIDSCKPNKFSLPGTPLYARFVAARKRCADKSVELVFHGTPEANVKAICREGLDPRRRAGQALGKGGAPARQNSATCP